MRKRAQPSRVAKARPVRKAGARRPAAGRRPEVRLPEDCTLSQADGLKLHLARLSSHVSSVTLQVGSVQRIDTACMQLLAAFVRDRAASGRAVRMGGDSRVFSEALRLLGLAPLFDPAIT
jgi:ABC-type transporter Mla MlaB component